MASIICSPLRGKSTKNGKMVFVTLTITYKIGSKFRGDEISIGHVSDIFLLHYQTVCCLEYALTIIWRYVNDKSEFDPFSLRTDKMLILQKLTCFCQFSRYFMHGMKHNLQFERGHAMSVLAFDLNLNFKVKYWPKFGICAKFQSKGWALVEW